MKEKFCWDLKDFFDSDEGFEKALSNLKLKLEDLKNNFSNLKIEEQLIKFYEINYLFEKLYAYSEMKSDLNMSDQKYLKYKNQVAEERRTLDEIKATMNSNILNSDLTLEECKKENSKLKDFYMHFYEVLRLKNHLVESPVVINETTLISRINDLYNTIQNVELSPATIKINEEEIKLTSKTMNHYLTDDDQEIRKTVFLIYLQNLGKVNKSISSLFLMRYKICFDIAKEKGYSSILEQTLQEDDLHMGIIDNLLKTVHKNLPLMKRYMNLKKQKLQVSELHYYDLKKSSSFSSKVSFEDGLAFVLKSLEILGADYQSKLD